ncbi:hypothetical protein FRY98_23370 [Paenibacillus faecis]|uniref:Gp5/Type VI secretion system Vgr protein OB-fold domain-containing protein n=2 Tax=Paenibacillus TaxID=44249 RepID=A0A5D0CL44_9BACL|nr:hypothetical protein FRY98_23370 [Paenibacillus faecis]
MSGMSSSLVVDYNTLKIAPFEMKLLELKLEKKFQDHARLRFTGIIAEEMEEKYVKMASEQLPVEMYYTDHKGKVHTLFHGLILKLHVRVDRDAYWLEAEAVSHTYGMDIKPQYRSYQNAAMKIPEVMEHIFKTYERASLLNTFTEQKKLGGFTLQYQETDWEFLKRLASHYHAPLVPSVAQSRICVYLGVPEHQDVGEIQATHYRVYKDILAYKNIVDNEQASLTEQDFICYEIVTDQVLELGDMVTFKGKKLHVSEVLTEMHRSILTHTYTLRSKRAAYQRKSYNRRIIGASIQGKVKDVVRDEVKVQLEYDQDWDTKTAYLFPYSTMYASEDQTGWYCMPEKGDDVRIYFPGAKEAEGIALSTVRKKLPAEAMGAASGTGAGAGVGSNTKTVTNTVVKTEQLQPIVHYDKDLKEDLMANPDTKFIMTPYGQQIKFEKDKITIIGAGGGAWISLMNEGTLVLNSNNKISLHTGKQIEMAANSIVLLGNQIEMSTKDGPSGIKLDQGQIQIKGVEVVMEE